MQQLSVAIVGCGNIFNVHADAMKKNPACRLECVVDIDEPKAKAAAGKYNCPYHTDYRKVLSDEGIKAVHICTPHYLHDVMATEALKSGKHVLVEKPVAISGFCAEKLAEAQKLAGKTLGVCFQNRYNTTSKKIKEFLDSGKAGRIKGAKAFVTWNRDSDYYQSAKWRGTWKYEGGGVLINQAIHTLDLLQWFLGGVEKIKGHTDTRLLKGIVEVEDTAEAMISFESGARALFYATNCYVSDSPVEIEIICDNAVIKLDSTLRITFHDGTTEEYHDLSPDGIGRSYWGCGHQLLIDDFYRCILEDRYFPIDAVEGKKALRIVEAIYNSSRTDKEIML